MSALVEALRDADRNENKQFRRIYTYNSIYKNKISNLQFNIEYRLIPF